MAACTESGRNCSSRAAVSRSATGLSCWTGADRLRGTRPGGHADLHSYPLDWIEGFARQEGTMRLADGPDD